MNRYLEWLNSTFLSEEDKNALKKMTDKEIQEAFSSDLKFGTAGIRGIMGLGTNRINKYTISKVTFGLANYLNNNYKKPKVVIAYDTRKNSKKFAVSTALILNKNNIETYIYPEVASTPELSFAITYLKCDAGIVITSSHNASIYNGYKVYNSLGSQITYPEDELIINEINKINDISVIKEDVITNKLYHILDDKIRKDFLLENLKVIINKDVIKKYSKDIKVTYTSFHGTGLKLSKQIFDMFDIKANYVIEQCSIDSEFPYAKEPNPEYIENYDLAIKYAKENDSDVILASDPDSDRLGVMIKTDVGYKLLNGNIVGNMFLYYILSNNSSINNKYVVRSIVTSNLVDKIANYFNIKVIEVLTGCKNIASVRNNDKDNYLFGFEESLGYMFNINVNDKNCFSSMIFLIEIMSYLKENNKTIDDYINDIYTKFGYYNDKNISIEFKEFDGMKKISNIMDKLRNSNVFNEKEKIDYLNREDNLKTNALKFILDDDSYFMVRPSGTEPKIKIYIFTKGNSIIDVNNKINNIERNIKDNI